MANFQDSKFLGVSPKALGLVVVAGLTVVGLFFMPETLKFLFDAEKKGTRLASAPSREGKEDVSPRGASRASLSKTALQDVKSPISEGKSGAVANQGVTVKRTPTRPKSGAGILSGLDF